MEMKRVDSTNDFAREQAESGLGRHGDVFVTREQTAGRGQIGKSWQSEPGQNLAMSILLENRCLPDPTPFHLSACIALASLDTLTPITQGDTAIKWPNDLYWNNRKLGGILIETGREWTVVGIGINVNQTQFPESLMNPVSLKQITGKDQDPIAGARQIIHTLNQRLSDWSENGFDPLFATYQACLFGKDRIFSVRENGQEKQIRIQGVTPDGALCIEEAGKRRTVVSGMEWLIKP